MVNLKGQSIFEYTVLIIAVVAGLLCMQIYLKRGLQGRLRLGADTLSETQYSPGQSTANMRTLITLNVEETSSGGLSNVHTDEYRMRTADKESINRQ